MEEPISIPMKLIAIGACYPCLTEMCTHPKADGSDFKHPTGKQQPAAVTAFKGTLLCGACALDWAKRMVELAVAKQAEEPSHEPA